MRKPLLVLLLMSLAGMAAAKPWWMRGVQSNETDFLPPDLAFRVSAGVEGNVLRVRWVIADGYYLYRSRMNIQPESPDLQLAAPVLPRGIVKVDPYLGTQEIYEQQVEATAAFTRTDGGAHPLQVKVTYQGCALAGLCYPPITRVIFPQRVTLAEPATLAWQPWEAVAILAGGFAFLLAGLFLRKGRKLDLPAA